MIANDCEPKAMPTKPATPGLNAWQPLSGRESTAMALAGENASLREMAGQTFTTHTARQQMLAFAHGDFEGIIVRRKVAGRVQLDGNVSTSK